MKKIIIIGAGGHAKVIANIIELNGDNILGYLDDNKKSNTSINVIGRIEDIGKFDGCEYIVAIGNGDVRKKIMEKKVKWYSAIHPSAIIDKSVNIGEGTCVMANAVINADTKIGRGVIINTASTIDHDCNVSNYVHVAPGVHISGTVSIGEKTWVGVGAIISNNIIICDNCVIGAGAVVVKNIDSIGTYVGVPAKRIDK